MDFIHDELSASGVAGYALSFFVGPDLYTRAHGYARKPLDPPVMKHSTNLRHFLGSMEKTASAVATFMSLCAHGLTIDDSIAPFLPDEPDKSFLAPGCNVSKLSFGQLMSMTSGLNRHLLAKEWDAFKVLGQNLCESPYSEWSYQNANFAALRFLLFHMWGHKFTDAPGKVGALPRYLYNYNVDCSRFLRDFMTDYVLNPAGIASPRWGYHKHSLGEPVAASDDLQFVPIRYRSGRDDLRGVPFPTGENLVGVGVGSLYLSSTEWLKFVRRLAHGHYLPGEYMDMMNTSYLPYDPDSIRYLMGMWEIPGYWGNYLNHNGLQTVQSPGARHGDLQGFQASENPDVGANTAFMIYPYGDVQAVLLINSVPVGSLRVLLRTAYDSAWEVVQ